MAFPQFNDIARFQHTLNDESYFKKLKRYGSNGVFVQLNYGYGYTNPFAGLQLRLSLKYLKFTGIYAFFLGNSVAEAKYFLAQAHHYGMDEDKSTPVMLDVEPNQSYNGPQTALINKWTNIVYKYGFHNIFIYSMAGWLRDGYHIKPELLKHGHIWAASYGTNEPGVNNALAWQNTDNWHGLHTDGDMLFGNVSIMQGSHKAKPKRKVAKKPKHVIKKHVTKKRVPKEKDLTRGAYFEAISNLDGFSASDFKKKNGDFLPKGARFHGMIVSDGQVKRIKTGLGYYSANVKLVKAI